MLVILAWSAAIGHSQYTSQPVPILDISPLGIDWRFPVNPQNGYYYLISIQQLQPTPTPATEDSWKTVYFTDANDLSNSDVDLSLSVEYSLQFRDPFTYGLSPSSSYQFRFELRGASDFWPWFYINASTPAIESDPPEITNVMVSAYILEVTFRLTLSRPILPGDVQIVGQKRKLDLDTGEEHPWVSFGLGFFQTGSPLHTLHLHSSQKGPNIVYFSDPYPFSWETQYRFRALGHSFGEWTEPVNVTLPRPQRLRLSSNILAYSSFYSGNALDAPNIDVTAYTDETSLYWNDPYPGYIDGVTLSFQYERTAPELGLNDSFVLAYQGTAWVFDTQLAPNETYLWRARALHHGLNLYSNYSNTVQITNGPATNTRPIPYASPAYNWDIIPSSVPGLYYYCHQVYRGLVEQIVEVQVTNLVDPSKSFRWQRYFSGLELDDSFWLMGCIEGGPEHLILSAGNYQVSMRTKGPEGRSNWGLIQNFSLADASNSSAPTANSGVLDEGKPLPEAYIATFEKITRNRLKVVQLAVLPTSLVDDLKTYLNTSSRLQYSTTGLTGVFVDLGTKPADQAALFKTGWQLDLKVNTLLAFRARYENSTAVSAWSAPFWVHHTQVGEPYALVFNSEIWYESAITTFNLATNVKALGDLHSLSLQLSPDQTFTNTNLTEGEEEEGIAMTFHGLPPFSDFQPTFTYLPTPSATPIELHIDAIHSPATYLPSTPDVDLGGGSTSLRINIRTSTVWTGIFGEIREYTPNSTAEVEWKLMCNLTNSDFGPDDLGYFYQLRVCEFTGARANTLYILRLTTSYVSATPSDPMISYHVIRSGWDEEPSIPTLTPDFDSCPFWTTVYYYYFEAGFKDKYYHVEISQGISSYNTTGVYARDWFPVATGPTSALDFEPYGTGYFTGKVNIPYYLAPRKFYYLRVGLSSTASGPVEAWGERLVDQPRLPLSQLPDCCILADLCDEPGPPECLGPKPSVYPFAFCRDRIWMVKSSDLQQYVQSENPYLDNTGTTYVLANLNLTANSTAIYVFSETTLTSGGALVNVSGTAVVDGRLIFEIPKSLFSNGTAIAFLNSAGVSGTPSDIVVRLLDEDSDCPPQVRGLPEANSGSLSILFVSTQPSCPGPTSPDSPPDSNDMDGGVGGLSDGAVAGVVIAFVVAAAGAIGGGGYAYKLHKKRKEVQEMGEKLAKLQTASPTKPGVAGKVPSPPKFGSWESVSTKPMLHNVV